MQLTQALTLVPERTREDKEEDIGSARMPMDNIISFLKSPVRDIPLIEFDLPKIFAFYKKKGAEDNEAKESMHGVVDFLKQMWDDSDEESMVGKLVEKIVGKSVRKIGEFILRAIVGTIWRITKWLVKKVVGWVIKSAIRWLVMPVLEAVAGFLLTPVGLALAITGGVLGGAYLVYNAFFAKKTEKPKTESLDDDDLSATTNAANSLLRAPETNTANAPTGESTPAAAPSRTSESSLTGAAAPMAAGAPVAASSPPSDTKKMIMQHEGVRTRPYKDSKGLWTVGVGHLIGDGKSLPDSWNREFSKEEVYALFDQDYEYHKKAAMKIPNFSRLGEKAQAALIDLTFNMGPAWYTRWPKLVQAMKDFDIAAVISNLRNSAWAKQVQASRVSDVLSLLATELSGTAAASETPKMVPGTTTAATKQNQIKAADTAARPGVSVPPPSNEKTIIKTPSGQLVAANMN